MLDGVTTIVKVAHARLAMSRMMFVRAYPRGLQEMVFDAQQASVRILQGRVRPSCAHGVYDNMKGAVETIFVRKDGQYNRRFLQMCFHHLVEPVACTPASAPHPRRCAGLLMRAIVPVARPGTRRRSAADADLVRRLCS